MFSNKRKRQFDDDEPKTGQRFWSPKMPISLSSGEWNNPARWPDIHARYMCRKYDVWYYERFTSRPSDKKIVARACEKHGVDPKIFKGDTLPTLEQIKAAATEAAATAAEGAAEATTVKEENIPSVLRTLANGIYELSQREQQEGAASLVDVLRTLAAGVNELSKEKKQKEEK